MNEKGKSTFRPEGVYVAMMTPFRGNWSINEEMARRTVNFLIEKWVDGIFTLSSVGEFIHLNFGEKISLMEIVHDEARGKVAVTPGATATNAKESIALEIRGFKMGPPIQPLSDAEQLRCDGARSRIEKIMRPFLKNLEEASSAL